MATGLSPSSLKTSLRRAPRLDALDVLGLATAGVLGALTTTGNVPAALAVVGIVLLASQVRSSRRLVALALVLPLLPLLQGVPNSIPVGGKNLYFTDVLLPLGLGLAMAAGRVRWYAWRQVLSDVAPYAAVLALGSAIGLLRGVSLSFMLRDLRGPVYVLLAFSVTVLMFRERDRRAALWVLAGVLWSTAALVIVESSTGMQLLGGRIEAVGRVEAAMNGAGLDATRFLLASKDLALLCCCGGLALLLRGSTLGLWARWGPALVAPSVLLVFFSFSRRALLALAIATLFVILVTNFNRLVVRTAAMLPVVAGVVLFAALAPIPSDSYVSRQATAFSSRVLDGLSSEARSEDEGIAFREAENGHALRSFRTSPVVGLGLGATYRPDLPGQRVLGEDSDYGRTFIHNFYLGVAVKLGLLGLLAFAFLVLRPIVAITRCASRQEGQRDQILIALAAGVLGLCAVNWVAPIFNEPATAIVLGCALGVMRLHTLPASIRTNQPNHCKHIPTGSNLG